VKSYILTLDYIQNKTYCQCSKCGRKLVYATSNTLAG
jgi:RNA polymerase-binding transcription factor DksA